MYENFYKKLHELAVIPVVVLEHADQAEPMAKALVEGGMPSAEVTFRTDCAAEVIRRMRVAHPEMCVGAGTVLSVEQVEEAVDAGAAFIVSPGFDAKVVERCIELKVPVLPGTVTPTEVIEAEQLGLKVTKFFPAEQYGGLATIKSLCAPFTSHRFMPTGGVSLANVGEYLSSPCVVACGGTWMVKPALFADGDFSQVTEKAKEAMEAARKARA